MNQKLKTRLKRLAVTSLAAIQMFTIIGHGILLHQDEYEITISDGVTYKKVLQTHENGVQSINMIIADIQNSSAELKLLYNDSAGYVNRETLTTLTKQESGTVAAINGDFFSTTNPSYTTGPMMDDGKVMSSPHYDNGKLASFMIDQNQKMIIDYLRSGVVIENKTTSGSTTGYSINKHSTNYANPIVITNEYMKKTPGQSGITNGEITEVIVRSNVVAEIRIGKAATDVPRDGFAIVASGDRGKQLQSAFKLNDRVELKTNFEGAYPNLETVIGGGTMILKDGMLAPITHTVAGKSQRTAIGITWDSKVVFMTVDGRTSPYIGMDEKDVADFLRTQNVRDAMMLDGGGSTQMIVNGSTVNTLATERKIINGIAIVNNNPKGALRELEAVLETKNIVQGDKVKLIVQGFDAKYNPVSLGSISVTGQGIDLSYKDGYITFNSGGNGNIIVKSGAASTLVPVNVVSSNPRDQRKDESITSYDFAMIPDTSKDKSDVLSQAVNGLLSDKVNKNGKSAINIFNKNQELSDSIKVTKDSVYQGAQTLVRDGITFVGVDVTNGIGGVNNQWKAIKEAVEGNSKNVILVLNGSMNLNSSEKSTLRSMLQNNSKNKSIFVISKENDYGSHSEGNVSYINVRDFSNIKTGNEDVYKYLVFKKNGDNLTYNFQRIF